MCYNSIELTKINPRPPLSGESAIERAVGEVLCIERTNHYRLGEYYEDTKVLDEKIFSLSAGMKSFTYIDKPTAVSPDAYYDKNDVIPSFADSLGLRRTGGMRYRSCHTPLYNT